jgi:hypothetical protein
MKMDSGIDASSEFRAYSNDPSPRTLSELLRAANSLESRNELVEALRRLSFQSENWRVSQHLCLVLLDRGLLVHAEFFAHRAVIESRGDPFARLALADILWRRRLPFAVYFQETHIRRECRRIKSRPRRRLAQTQLAELMAKSAAYMCDLKTALPWFNHVRKVGGQVETWLQVFLAAAYLDARTVQVESALKLAPFADQFGGQTHARVLRGVRLGLLELLRGRK